MTEASASVCLILAMARLSTELKRTYFGFALSSNHIGLFESGLQLTIQLHSTVQGRYKRHPFFEAICESMSEENTKKIIKRK